MLEKKDQDICFHDAIPPLKIALNFRNILMPMKQRHTHKNSCEHCDIVLGRNDPHHVPYMLQTSFQFIIINALHYACAIK